MRQFLQRLTPILIAMFSVIRITWFILVFELLIFVAFTQVGQTRDILQALVDRDPDFHPWRTVAMFLFLVTWAIASWYSARIILHLVERDEEADNKYLPGFENWLPRFYGAFPFLIVSAAMPPPTMGGFPTLEVIVWGLMVVFVLWTVFRSSMLQDSYGFEGESRSFQDLDSITKGLVYFAIGLFVTSLVVFSIKSFGSRVSEVLGTPALIFLFATVWTVFFMITSYQDQRTKIPITLIIFIYATVVTSQFNDGHYMRVIKESPIDKDQDPRLHLDNHLINWMIQRQDEWTDSTVKSYPIYFVAAEGGGIRSAYWVAQVLAQMEKQLPGFSNQLYGMSGVSGGSLGVSTYSCLLHDLPDLYPATWRDSLASKSKAFLQQDYLSPLGSALLFPTLVSKGLPFPMPIFDRSRWLEDAWGAGYARVVEGRRTFDKGVVEIWEGSTYAVPAVFLNSSRVETGQWLISSQVSLEVDEFENDVDLVDTVGFDIPMKTATLMSARFPILTPPGFVPRTEGDDFNRRWTHGVDGGFLDNSGLETLMKVISNANKAIVELRERGFEGAEKLHPTIILIKNSAATDFDPSPLRGGYEIVSPIQAVANGRLNGIYAEMINARSNFENSIVDGSFFAFQLSHVEGLLPLGWYLSEAAQANMDRQAERIAMLNPTEPDSISLLNSRQFEILRELHDGERLEPYLGF